MTYLIILFRSTLFYLLINIFYRLMGKREIGELSIMDFIVSMFIAEVAAISIENYKESILISLIPIIVLVVLSLLIIIRESLILSLIRFILKRILLRLMRLLIGLLKRILWIQ